jgi:tetratricopeptide (TPR) repeat protein
MKRFLGITAVALALAAAAGFAGVAAVRWLAVRGDLADGQQALDRRDFSRAAARFQSALDHDPYSTRARLSLATAYAAQYIPGGESDANVALAEQALAEYQRLLQTEPANAAALRGTAALYDGQSRYEDARFWYRRLVSVDPANADAYASLSTVAWKQVSEAILDARARAGLAPDDGLPIGDVALGRDLRARWSDTIAAGIADATRALSIDPGHDGAMSILSAWHRVSADLADTTDGYRQETAAAEHWRQKALGIRRTRPTPAVQAAAEAPR